MTSAPKFRELEDGRTIANFTMTTKEPYVDEKGNPKSVSHWHRLTAWGNSLAELREIAEPGSQMAVEGKLVTRFYKDKSGKRQQVSEIEVNSLFIV